MKYDYSYIYSLFKDFYITDDFYDSAEITYQIEENLTKNMSVRYGASKLVCVPKDKKYVIKLPFNAVLDEGSDEEGFDADEIVRLIGASGDIEDALWDYCAREVFLYEAARSDEIAFAFPETEYVGLINGWPVYVQEICKTLYEKENTKFPTEAEENKVISFLASKNKYSTINDAWITMFCLQYGEEKTIELLDFIKFYKINDLHSSNIGFSAIDGRPVIVDFSGFYK